MQRHNGRQGKKRCSSTWLFENFAFKAQFVADFLVALEKCDSEFVLMMVLRCCWFVCLFARIEREINVQHDSVLKGLDLF